MSQAIPGHGFRWGWSWPQGGYAAWCRCGWESGKVKIHRASERTLRAMFEQHKEQVRSDKGDQTA
jgi:hypothetical protein